MILLEIITFIWFADWNKFMQCRDFPSDLGDKHST